MTHWSERVTYERVTHDHERVTNWGERVTYERVNSLGRESDL